MTAQSILRPALATALFIAACGSPTQPDGGANDSGTGSDGTAGDGGGMCGAGVGVCNPVTNAGCAMGQACSIAAGAGGMLTTACGMPGAGGYGATCATPASCMQGFACLNGTCAKLCCRVGDDSPCRTGPGGVAGASCQLRITGGDVMACLAPVRCDWFAQDCPGGANCQPLAGGGTSCVVSGTGTEGMPCGEGTTTNCARGFACIASGTAGACRQICNPEARGGDAGGGGDAAVDVASSDVGTDSGTGDAGVDGSDDGGAMDVGSADAAIDAGASDAVVEDRPTVSDVPAPTDAPSFPMTCPGGFVCNGVTGAPSTYGACVPM